MSKLDPILLALTQNRLDNISLEMGYVMSRTARSPIFNQSHDFSCFIGDRHGHLVSQADGLPIHTGGGGFALRALLSKFGDAIDDGDIFLLNDPYVAGGNHLPDWTIIRPVFVDGRVVAFACNRAHQSDIGGGAAGTYNPEATEIFHEGIRLPPLKLIEKGETRKDLWELLLLNSRTPSLLDGDLRAMIGSTAIGANRIVSLVRELGVAQYAAYFDGLLDHAEARIRRNISTLRDGVYEAQEISYNDCFGAAEVLIKIILTIQGSDIQVDFSQSSGQIRGFKNSSQANTYSSVLLGLASFFEPDMPRNEGTLRPVEIVAPEGSIVNPRPPAPVTMCTVSIAHEIVHCMWKALAQARPELACAGWGKSLNGISSGKWPQTGERYVLHHWGAMSGGGAVKGRDGFNQIGHLIALGGLTLPNVETFEQLYPVRFHRQEFRQDSGGAGTYRGGTGIEYEVETLGAAEYAFRGEGVDRRSGGWGVHGGRVGEGGEIIVHVAGHPPFTAPPYGTKAFGPARMVARSCGGGGWGDPVERDPELVLRDVRDGLVSIAEAARVYGVVLNADRRSVDIAETDRERVKRKSAASSRERTE